MKMNGRKKLYHWFSILLVGLALCGCGSKEHGASEALSVSLELPAGESELFWYGVEAKKLVVMREGKAIVESTWNQGQSLPCELNTGDELTFTGFDGNGRAVILGTARVGEEKKVSIPLRRILY
ncbi:MAG: hypothetical protein ACXWQO_20025 [Bdellovibrionota bacterium]